MPKNKKLALELGIQSCQILTNDDEVCIPCLSSILIAHSFRNKNIKFYSTYLNFTHFLDAEVVD